MADEPADVVQPEQGQGDGGSGGPWSDLLDRVPEDARGDFESRFKEWDGNYTRHQQEAAEYRKSWEPYEQLGVNQYSPDQVSYLLQLGQALENPQQMQEWWNQYAQQNGLTQAETEQLQEQVGYEDPTQQLLKEQLGPITQQLDQIRQWQEQQEFAVREREATEFIEGQLRELEEKHPQEFRRDLIEAFVGQYIDNDPRNAVTRAFEDARRFTADIEKQALQSKVNAPAGAESGGAPDTVPKEIKTLAEANKYALEQMRAARNA